jgi:hypothetical protein
VRILEIDEERRRISLSVKRAQANDNLPLRDLIPPELQPDNQPPAPPEPEAGVPDLDLSEEVFSDAPAAEPAAEAPVEEPVAEEPVAEVADPQPPAEQVVEEQAEEAAEEAAAEEPDSESGEEPTA